MKKGGGFFLGPKCHLYFRNPSVLWRGQFSKMNHFSSQELLSTMGSQYGLNFLQLTTLFICFVRIYGSTIKNTRSPIQVSRGTFVTPKKIGRLVWPADRFKPLLGDSWACVFRYFFFFSTFLPFICIFGIRPCSGGVDVEKWTIFFVTHTTL